MIKPNSSHDLHQQYGTLRMFANAMGSPLYRAEQMEFITALIGACDTLTAEIEPYCERATEVRAAMYQWRMDDQAFTPSPMPT